MEDTNARLDETVFLELMQHLDERPYQNQEKRKLLQECFVRSETYSELLKNLASGLPWQMVNEPFRDYIVRVMLAVRCEILNSGEIFDLGKIELQKCRRELEDCRRQLDDYRNLGSYERVAHLSAIGQIYEHSQDLGLDEY